ncbi:hypothetical protein Nepgr_011746 [Nepenthes gracilis]|uniref:Uncharacterized protein n=1 Tax=Nepenthes gracilis TaxID=150966 RepID=A0AAD3SEL9_NEPGR|nr:hypothetical protein Nepgr_011746 [Nepenthes gracilis]
MGTSNFDMMRKAAVKGLKMDANGNLKRLQPATEDIRQIPFTFTYARMQGSSASLIAYAQFLNNAGAAAPPPLASTSSSPNFEFGF